MSMLIVMYTLVVYPGIIGGLEAGSLTIPEAIFELAVAVVIHVIIYMVYTAIKSRNRRNKRARH